MTGREVQVGAADLCLVTFSPSSDVALSGSRQAAATVQTCTPASGLEQLCHLQHADTDHSVVHTLIICIFETTGIIM